MTNLTQPPKALLELITRPLAARSRIIAAFLYDCDPDGPDCKDAVGWIIGTLRESVRQLNEAHVKLRELTATHTETVRQLEAAHLRVRELEGVTHGL